MTRQAFMAALRAGLRGLPQRTVDEIAADYESHFSEGVGAGRTEAQVAAALGDPRRLARELKAEAGLKRWETERNPSSAIAALAAVLGLATIDILILLPMLIALGGILFGLFMTALGLGVGGLVLAVSSIAGATFGPMVDKTTAVLLGLGLTSLGVALGALLIPVVAGIVHLLVRYARLHYRLLQPALESKTQEAVS
jgi:uncharacterized membrane protein